VGERGLLAHAVGDPALLDAQVAEVLEPPFPVVAAAEPVRTALELLAGERPAVLVTADGEPAGILTRADLLEALAE
jgi:cystathionine beta-synthase